MGAKHRTCLLLAAACVVTAACTGVPKSTSGTNVAAGRSPDTTVPLDASGAPLTGADGASDTTVAGGPAGTSRPRTGSSPSGGGAASTTVPGATGGGGGPSTAPPVDAPGDPQLFAGATNTHGITNDRIGLCGHAALTFGPAFNASADDFNVYYSAVNDAGGIHGRKIQATYENDNYDPATAVTAFNLCREKKPFMILGGIGFDQIPSVRQAAEDNKELYLYHIANAAGSAGKRYSFTTQASVEQTGESFAELIAARFKGRKVGVLYRASEYWSPGFDTFKKVAAERGLEIVKAVPVQKNQVNYTQALIELRNAGAEIVWGWENTLALTQMVQQAKGQDWHPQWVAFPFNLTAQTLGDDALEPPMLGLATWPGYSKGDYGGSFSSYAAEMKEFEAQYAKYRPNTDIGGVAGDLLWLNWVEQKRIVEMFRACGRDCTRNHFAGLLVNGYKATTSPTCPLDFSLGSNGSGGFVNVMETFRSPSSGKVNWQSVALCRTRDFAGT